jgi:type II secretory pathway pseudopilin PulG
MKRQRGAALMIMLMIAGVLGAMFAIQLAGRAGSARAQVAATTLALSQAQEALIGFALVNGRLPRPAISGTDGREQTVACVSEAACTGLLPWATLGVNKLDSWGKALGYSVTKGFSETGLQLSTLPTKKVQTRNATGALVFAKGSSAACVAATPGATDVPAACAPAVLFSVGKANFGTTDAGALLGNLSVSTTNVDEMINSTAAPLIAPYFVQRAASDNTAATGGEFDDIVIWLSGNILFKRMIDAGRSIPP